MIVQEFSVRRASLEDISAFARLRLLRGHDDAVAARLAREEITRHLDSEEHAVFLAWEGERAIGYGRAQFYPGGRDLYDTLRPLPEGWYLRGIVVDPDFRRTGVATHLTRARLAWLGTRATGAYCFLDSEEAVALPMYQAEGFREVYADWPMANSAKGLLLGRRFLR